MFDFSHPALVWWLIGGGALVLVVVLAWLNGGANVAALWSNLLHSPDLNRLSFAARVINGIRNLSEPLVKDANQPDERAEDEAFDIGLRAPSPGTSPTTLLRAGYALEAAEPSYNGLNFFARRCISCQLCVYVCPADAVHTREMERGYIRRFDMSACVFCGLCVAACPTSAIELTIDPHPARRDQNDMAVQSNVLWERCPTCGRAVPQPNLFADRIYALPTGDNDARAQPSNPVWSGIIDQKEARLYGEQAVAPHTLRYVDDDNPAPCPTCHSDVTAMAARVAAMERDEADDAAAEEANVREDE